MKRSFQLVLARWQDRLQLLLMVVFAALAVIAMLDRPPRVAVPPAGATLVAFLLGALIAAAQRHRLESLARHSIAAPLALEPAARAAHLAALGLLSFLLAFAAARSAALTGFLSWPAIGLVGVAWAAGMLVGAAGAARWSRHIWHRATPPTPVRRPSPSSGGLLAITLGAQLPFRAPLPALLAAFAIGVAQAVTAGILALSLTPVAGGVLTVLAALAASFAIARVPAASCRFAIFAGVPTAHALGAHLAAPLALSAGSLVGALILYSVAPGLPWLELGCGLVAMLVVALRVLHYRLHPKARADRLMQAQLLLLVMVAFGLPPLAPLLVVFRTVMLVRANRDTMWALV
jgi:hypothetical protein